SGGRLAAVVAAENKENKENENKPETEGLAAADYTESDFAPKTSGSSYAWDIFKLLIILGLMVGGFYYFFRYISKKTGINARGGDIMRTIAVLPIGQNKHIQVVELAGKLLVLGVADGGINLITEITNKDDIDRIRLMSSFDDKPPGGSSTFQDFLKERIGRGIGKVTGKIYERRPTGARTYEYIDESGNDIEYIKNQNGRLKKL
ncbi:MAG: flagellar biosynthetic protein FliO, partial [Leptospirales bacterium]|nr:flagellar biosynthetic protein FliO [Leptospirales bacterium]